MSHRRFPGGRLVVATHNPGKLVELRSLFAPFTTDLVSAGELGLPEPEETGLTFTANAELKARAAATASGFTSLADDSGLCVTALDDAPGIYSARWAGPDKDFRHAMKRVETELKEKGLNTSPACFVCALSLGFPDGHCETFEGRIDGTLTFPPRGTRGFGYDPIFQPDGFAITFGEMDPDAKHAMSHRARAFTQLIAACFDA
ncbi:MAG: RdgB/HAM1 family non-canonical purine NTP pyrophosphatase [Micropepsaceae bacterium]